MSKLHKLINLLTLLEIHFHSHRMDYENITGKNQEKEFLLGRDANRMIDRDERTRLSYAI